MPVYEYVCNTCSHRFETLVRSTDQSVLCPQCDSRKISKCFSTFAYRGSSVGQEGASSPGSSPNGCGSCSSRNCASCG